MSLAIEQLKQTIKLTQSASKAVMESKDSDTVTIADKFLQASLESLIVVSGVYSVTYNLALESYREGNKKRAIDIISSVTEGHLNSLKYFPRLEGLLFDDNSEEIEPVYLSDSLDDKLIVYNDILVSSVDTINELSLIEKLSSSKEVVTQELYDDIVTQIVIWLAAEDTIASEDFKEKLKVGASKGYELLKSGLYKSSILLRKMTYGMMEFIKSYHVRYKNLLKDITEVQTNFNIIKRSKRDLELKRKTVNLHLLNIPNDDITKYSGKTDEVGMIGLYENSEELIYLLKEYTIDIKQIKNSITKVMQTERAIFRNKSQILSYIEGKGDIEALRKLINNINEYINTTMNNLYFSNTLYHVPNISLHFEQGRFFKKKSGNTPSNIKFIIDNETVDNEKDLINGIVDFIDHSSDLDSILTTIYEGTRGNEVSVLIELIKGVEKISNDDEIEKEELQHEFSDIKKLYKAISNYKTMKTIVMNDITIYVAYQNENMSKLMETLYRSE